MTQHGITLRWRCDHPRMQVWRAQALTTPGVDLKVQPAPSAAKNALGQPDVWLWEAYCAQHGALSTGSATALVEAKVAAEQAAAEIIK